jgi:hypothetical protein
MLSRTALLVTLAWTLSPPLAWPAAAGEVRILVTDRATGKPVPCRIHLRDSAGKPVPAAKLPFWRDHFVCPGTVRLELPAGRYPFEVERGPEYYRETGTITVADGRQDVKVVLRRLRDLPAEGWWPGELHVHRAVEDIELLMRAEDLYVAPVITWWNDRNQWAQKRLPDEPLVRFDTNRYYHLMAGEDERDGGALLYFNLRRPLVIAGVGREYPSPMKFLAEARRVKGVKVDVEKPFWWDVPVWLASGQVDTIGLANNHMCRSRMYEDEAWGRPRDVQRLPPPLGNGYWTQEIYYHILNTGLRLPPSAGSASGVLPNPVGYNRVYVHTGKELSYEKWWQGLCAGRSFVTNGPLLTVTVNGELAGHVFTVPAGTELELEIKAELTAREPVPVIEVIRNGRVEWAVPSRTVQKTGSLGKVKFKESGWLLVRAIADNRTTFRFASTAPYYVEVGPAKRRVSKASVQFFLDWIDERQKRIKLTDPDQRREVVGHHEAARKFWEGLLREANAP